MRGPLPEDTPSQNPFCQPRELSHGLLLWMDTCRSEAQRQPTFVFPEAKLLSFPKKPREALGSASLGSWFSSSLALLHGKTRGVGEAWRQTPCQPGVGEASGHERPFQ